MFLCLMHYSFKNEALQYSVFVVSGFTGLSLVDQMALLQSGWMETLVLNVVWRSQGSADELQFAENLRLNESQSRAAGLHDLYTALRHLTSKYQQMGLNQEEMLTLKAMSLANSGIHTVYDQQFIHFNSWSECQGLNLIISKNK